jgi:hypothetical protein
MKDMLIVVDIASLVLLRFSSPLLCFSSSWFVSPYLEVLL